MVTDPVPEGVVRGLEERIRSAQIASCNCQTKTPEIEFHEPTCRYRVLEEALAALSAPRDPSAQQLAVWYGEMPESNGRRNWTASLHQKGRDPHVDGFCFARSECPGRVRYQADRMRWVVGIGPEPDILHYDDKSHSGYVEPDHGPSVGETARGLLEKWRDGEFESGADTAADKQCRCGVCGDRFEASPIIEAWLTALAKETG